jgi:hypothetical protein
MRAAPLLRPVVVPIITVGRKSPDDPPENSLHRSGLGFAGYLAYHDGEARNAG